MSCGDFCIFYIYVLVKPIIIMIGIDLFKDLQKTSGSVNGIWSIERRMKIIAVE